MSEATFEGTVGRTAADSTPWWPAPVRPPRGAPNVVFIVFDDMGFADLGCYGSEIETPNIDRLATGGLRYTNFHTTALCSPTRACLLTGRNHHSVGMGGLANWNLGYPGHRGQVAHSAGTLAEMLRLQGYNCFATGKWHLTPMEETSPAGPYDQWPLARGFDRFYGFLEGETNQWKPELTSDNHVIDPPDRPGYHLTEDIVDTSIAFVRDQKSVAPEKPCFLYMCFGACHAPHQVPRPFIDKYVPVFEKGWDRTREDRLARQLALGIVPPGTRLPERNPGVKAWDACSEDEQRLYVRLQAAYAGMLDHTDQHIGRLLAFLEEIEQLDNTLIFLISDNGASQEGSPFGTVNAIRYMNQVRDALENSLEHIDEIGEEQLNNNYPWGWAMAGNTPLKRYKQNTHGGGVRDPLIVHWPEGIEERGGLRAQFHHVTDLTPTVLDLLGVTPPATINGVAQQPIEGTSLAYTFTQKDGASRKHTQYFEMLGNRGIWHDGWKAVAYHDPRATFDEDEWELYHLDEDFSEHDDLAQEQPGKLRELVERWWVEAGKYMVLPLSGAAGRFNASRTEYRERTHWVFFPGMSHLHNDAAPDLRNRSYSITAEVETDGVAEGVLISHGDSCSGYTLYVRDGRLVHDYNYVGTHYVVTATRPLPPGACTLGVRVVRTGDFAARAELLINGEACGDVDMPRTMRGLFSFNGLDVGRDRPVAVGPYPAPFPFSGTLKRVVVDMAMDQETDEAARLAAELARQ